MTRPDSKQAAVSADPSRERRSYQPPKCTAWGNVVDLTKGAGGGAADLGATSKNI